MSTQSILKSITLRDNAACLRLAKALEKAEKSSKPRREYDRKITDMTPEQIDKLFDGRV